MSHANAALTPRNREHIGRLVVEGGWTVAAAAAFFHASWPTANLWRNASRRRVASACRTGPHVRHSPASTPQSVLKKIVHLRWKKRLGLVQIAGILDIPVSTAHTVLVRCRLNRLFHIGIRTGRPARRYEHDSPGSLIHVDVKKLGSPTAEDGPSLAGSTATATGQRPPTSPGTGIVAP